MFSYLFLLMHTHTHTHPQKFSRQLRPTAGGHDSFPMLRFSVDRGQVSPVCVISNTSFRAAYKSGWRGGRDKEGDRKLAPLPAFNTLKYLP